MKHALLLLALLLIHPFASTAASQGARVEMNLNGTWQFDQTVSVFPPAQYTRTCPVPGLIHLATPKVEDYDKYIMSREDGMRKFGTGFKGLKEEINTDYVPKYNWYRRKIFIPKELEGKKASILVSKSKFVTHIYINNVEAGNSLSCFTPVECYIEKLLKYGEENEIVIRTGDRQWLPSCVPGMREQEIEYHLPGIWDDVKLIFTNELRASRVIVLPKALDGKVLIKTQMQSLYPRKRNHVAPNNDVCTVQVTIREKVSGKEVAKGEFKHNPMRGVPNEFEDVIALENPHLWCPEDPFLYQAEIVYLDKGQESDRVVKTFGMRDFECRGKSFFLNGKQIFLRGTNLTLHRFFEDPECQNLPWDRAWVTKLLTEQPQKLHWNAMRFSLGLAPDFWLDIADSCGMMIQNEWQLWQRHGQPQETKKQYTEWVWNDACHPSVIIWDAMNECTDAYIGNQLIPELKQLDPTRPWDNGFMGTGYTVGWTQDKKVDHDDMETPHLYSLSYFPDTTILINHLKRQPLHLGKFDNLQEFYPWLGGGFKMVRTVQVPQICNEYSWMWTWRDGTPSDLLTSTYSYFCGANSTKEENLEMQGYWLQVETEWLRVERELDGVFCFTYLTNNYDVTGDWWLDPVKDLKPNPALRWMAHAFNPTAVYMNLQDQRYMRYGEYYKPKETITFDVVGVNDLADDRPGRYTIRVIDSKGNTVKRKNGTITIPAYFKCYQSVSLQLPAKEDGYLLLLEYYPKGEKKPVLCRRYVQVGEGKKQYFDYKL